MNLVNGIEGGRIDPADRGLAYGDGVFRTLRLRNGKALLWPRQYAKLAADCFALDITCPGIAALEYDIEKITAVHTDGVVRITLTRGVAPRGYAIPGVANTTRIVGWSGEPPVRSDAHGIRARWCNLRLSRQPALAGIKHLNRLENVIARSEWNDSAIAEGLLLDSEGLVIGGTMSNLILMRAGELVTPALDACGVAGITRELIVERARCENMPVRIAPVATGDVRSADAVFLLNSVIGIRQIATLDDLNWKMHPVADQLRGWINYAENL